jgi:hypothetical protein
MRCQSVDNTESKQKLILLPNLIDNLEEKSGDEVKSKMIYITPGAPKFKIVFPEDDEIINHPKL